MAGTLRPFSLGWHPIDPGPGPRSDLLDAPPTPTGTGYAVAYGRWRAAVEADEQRLLQLHLAGPIWYPIQLLADVHVVPVYGGTPEAIEQVATTLVTSGLEVGVTCRVVNLSGWDLSGGLRRQMRTAKRNRVQFDEISSRGSTVNLFGNPRSHELIALLVDALRISAERSAGRQAQQEKHELDRVSKILDPPVTLDRIIAAVDIALGAVGAPGNLTVTEVRDLQDYFASVVSQRRATQDRLSDLHVDLEALRLFGKAATRTGQTVGGGQVTSVRWYDVASGSSSDELELGRQLLARAVLQAFTIPGPEELLLVIGAERLSDEVLDDMVNSAQRLGKRVVLIYTQINDAGQRMLGYAGSTVALFLRMPNPADAKAAAEFLGREYKFVINGISIADGQTQEWSKSFGTSTSAGTSRSTSTNSSSGWSGGAFNFSRSIGSSVSRSFERGSSSTNTSGGSSSTTQTTSAGRVHEYVIEPEVFQQMPDHLMMVVANATVTIASCENQLRRSRQTSKQEVMTLP